MQKKTKRICVCFSQTIPTSRLASLPPAFISDKPYANFYGLALAQLPPEEDDKIEAAKTFAQDALNRDLLLNVEYRYDAHLSIHLQCTKSEHSCYWFGIVIKHSQSKWSAIRNTNRSGNKYGYWTSIGCWWYPLGGKTPREEAESIGKSDRGVDSVSFRMTEEAKLESLVTGCGKSTLLC